MTTDGVKVRIDPPQDQMCHRKMTDVPPDRGTSSQFAYWSDGAEGVKPLDLGDREIVTIVATIVKRVDSYAYCRCKA